MYAAAIRRKNDNDSKGAAYSVAQSKSRGSRAKGFVDNRPETKRLRQLKAKIQNKRRSSTLQHLKKADDSINAEEVSENIAEQTINNREIQSNHPQIAQLDTFQQETKTHKQGEVGQMNPSLSPFHDNKGDSSGYLAPFPFSPPLGFMDNPTEAIVQRQLQEIVNNRLETNNAASLHAIKKQKESEKTIQRVGTTNNIIQRRPWEEDTSYGRLCYVDKERQLLYFPGNPTLYNSLEDDEVIETLSPERIEEIENEVAHDTHLEDAEEIENEVAHDTHLEDSENEVVEEQEVRQVEGHHYELYLGAVKQSDIYFSGTLEKLNTYRPFIYNSSTMAVTTAASPKLYFSRDVRSQSSTLATIRLKHDVEEKELTKETEHTLIPQRQKEYSTNFVQDEKSDIRVVENAPTTGHEVIGNEQPVRFAGEVTVKGKKIINSTNISGHYRPDSEDNPFK